MNQHQRLVPRLLPKEEFGVNEIMNHYLEVDPSPK